MSRAKQAVYFFGLLLWTTWVQAEESGQEQPSMELLEFLGQSEKVDGEWVDPLNMLDMQIDEQQDRQQEQSGND